MRLSDIIKKNSQQQPQQPVPQEAPQKPATEGTAEGSSFFKKERSLNAPSAGSDAPKQPEPKQEENAPVVTPEELYGKTIIEIKECLVALDKTKSYPQQIKVLHEIVDYISRDDEGLIVFTSKTTPDMYMYGQTANTLILSIALAASLNIPQNTIFMLGYFAFCLNLQILKKTGTGFKTGKLTQADIAQIKKFISIDTEILNRFEETLENVKLSILNTATEIKSRYPANPFSDLVKGEDLQTASQIISLALIYETITHPATQTEKFIPHETVKMIISKSEGVFAQDIVKAFVKMISIYPIGSYVKLNTNEIARVTGLNKDMPTRPKVYVLIDPNLNRSPQARTVNLSTSPMLFIKEAVDETKLNFTDKKLSIELKALRWWVKGI
jgi:HD-GYP domain-containing protein (c-di-GMP phosphodiesterase class II)